MAISREFDTKKLEEVLFEQFHRYLDNLGLFVNEGKIVDASNDRPNAAMVSHGAG